MAGSPMEGRGRWRCLEQWGSRMAWFRVRLSEEEQRIVGEERRQHPHEPTRRKMETLWLLHHGLTREKGAKIVGGSAGAAADRIQQLTGIRRGLSQTRSFLKKLGLRWQRMAALPVPPKKVSKNM